MCFQQYSNRFCHTLKTSNGFVNVNNCTSVKSTESFMPTLHGFYVQRGVIFNGFHTCTHTHTHTQCLANIRFLFTFQKQVGPPLKSSQTSRSVRCSMRQCNATTTPRRRKDDDKLSSLHGRQYHHYLTESVCACAWGDLVRGVMWRPYRLMNSRLISVDRSSTRPDRSRLASFCRKVPSLSPAIYLTRHAAPPSLPPHQYITDIITQNTRIIRFVDAVVWSVRRDESTALYDWLDTVPKSTCHWLRGGDVTVE